MNELKVKNVIIAQQNESSENYEKFKEIVRNKKIKVITVKQGDRLKIESYLHFDVLWPNSNFTASEEDLNNESLVCKLKYKSFSMLFTGDIEEIAEKHILQDYKDNLQFVNSVVLKVAHHGSKTSSTEEFVKAVSPKFALIGVGENNRFGHPNNDVIERLKNLRNKNISNR